MSSSSYGILDYFDDRRVPDPEPGGPPGGKEIAAAAALAMWLRGNPDHEAFVNRVRKAFSSMGDLNDLTETLTGIYNEAPEHVKRLVCEFVFLNCGRECDGYSFDKNVRDEELKLFQKGAPIYRGGGQNDDDSGDDDDSGEPTTTTTTTDDDGAVDEWFADPLCMNVGDPRNSLHAPMSSGNHGGLVLKRSGGGKTVLLVPGLVAVAVGLGILAEAEDVKRETQRKKIRDAWCGKGKSVYTVSLPRHPSAPEIRDGIYAALTAHPPHDLVAPVLRALANAVGDAASEALSCPRRGPCTFASEATLHVADVLRGDEVPPKLRDRAPAALRWFLTSGKRVRELCAGGRSSRWSPRILQDGKEKTHICLGAHPPDSVVLVPHDVGPGDSVNIPRYEKKVKSTLSHREVPGCIVRRGTGAGPACFVLRVSKHVLHAVNTDDRLKLSVNSPRKRSRDGDGPESELVREAVLSEFAGMEHLLGEMVS